MAKKQNSIYPSSIYPRLQSVDLQDDSIAPGNENSENFKEIDFENHVEAFKNKTTWEIVRALTVLKMCSANVLVNNSLAVSDFFFRLLIYQKKDSLIKYFSYKGLYVFIYIYIYIYE